MLLLTIRLFNQFYSAEIRKAAAVAKGAKTNDNNEHAANKERCACALMPCWLAATAPAPKISTGIYSGNTNNATNKPLPRTPNVKAAPIAPIKLNAGVPSNKDHTNTNKDSLGNPYCKPISGASNTTGNPHTIQCAEILANTNKAKGCGAISICSKLPSAKSAANIRFNEIMPASSAATQSTPGAILLKTAASGPMPKGNKLETMRKKNKVVATSERRRNASNKSRFSTIIQASFKR